MSPRFVPRFPWLAGGTLCFLSSFIYPFPLLPQPCWPFNVGGWRVLGSPFLDSPVASLDRDNSQGWTQERSPVR